MEFQPPQQISLKLVTSFRFQVSILFILVFSVGANAGDLGRMEWVPSWTIEKRSIDESIVPGRAKIYFTFYNPHGNILKNGSLTVYYGGKGIAIKTDSVGHATFPLPVGKHQLYLYGYDYREIVTDSIEFASQEKLNITVRFENDKEIRPMRKPVIYLYPPTTTDINVQLNVKGELTFTYPAYNTGWNVRAEPNGTLTSNGKAYNYLFWEGTTNQILPKKNKHEGAIVATDTLLQYLENSLTAMGLTSKEQQDFITYWYPHMQNNQLNFIRFVFNEDCNTYADLNITPAPNKIYRVYMLWATTSPGLITNLVKQEFPVLKREGFTVVEWGGMEIKPVELDFCGN